MPRPPLSLLSGARAIVAADARQDPAGGEPPRFVDRCRRARRIDSGGLGGVCRPEQDDPRRTVALALLECTEALAPRVVERGP